MCAVFFPSLAQVINEMLTRAMADSESVVYDLGSGDGSVVITAASDYCVKKAVGIEKDRRLCSIARSRTSHLKNAVIINGNYDSIGISEASIVTLYQSASENSRLRHKFLSELAEGTTIVSHDFGIPGWRPNEFLTIDVNRHTHRIMVYKIGFNTPLL